MLRPALSWLAALLPIAGAITTSPVTLAPCPRGGPVVDIPGSTDLAVQREQMELIRATLLIPGATVRLGPDVDLDFSSDTIPLVPLFIAPCVTLTSVASLRPMHGSDLAHVTGATTTPAPQPLRRGHAEIPAFGTPAAHDPDAPLALPPDESLPSVPQARTPRHRGPILRYGNQVGKDPEHFLVIDCPVGHTPSDHVRISGFQLFGPDSGPQTTSDAGITIHRCVDVEISNMEIMGWGSAGIELYDDSTTDQPLDATGPLGRITTPSQIRIRGNYFHHNQHPNEGGNADQVVGGYLVANFGFGAEGLLIWHELAPSPFSVGHALGYGIDVGPGAWAEITENVFDVNRHSIAAGGTAGGYNAERNLVLKGGGHHGSHFEDYTHTFDVHGTGCWWSSDLCGDAGTEFLYRWNAFQYRSGNSIKIRGKPLHLAKITANVFARTGLEDQTDEDAINLNTPDNVEIMANNLTGLDSFGQYGVCDFDGDGVDDLFLPTGVTWWFSSAARGPWSYLGQHAERLDQLRFGYFDGDSRCDVMVEQGGQWIYFSGGTGAGRPQGNFGAALADVEFGRFDPAQPDNRPGVSRQATHAFRRQADGQWQVTSLATPAWQSVASSSFPLDQLRFGDFTGDGVTDVLAVVDGRWAISESGRGPWHQINDNLGDPVRDLFITNLDADDNIDDLLRLERRPASIPVLSSNPQVGTIHLTWWRSRNGTQPWTRWREYDLPFVWPSTEQVLPWYGYAGRFGAGPGGETMVIDQNRIGHFFRPTISPADTLSAAAY